MRFFDGGPGTARQLRKRLAEQGLLAAKGQAGQVTFASSKDDPAELDLYREFFSRDL